MGADSRHQIVWRFPSRSLSGECLVIAGTGISLFGLGRLGTFGVIDPGWLALAAGGMIIATGIHWLRTPFHGVAWGQLPETPTPAVAGPAGWWGPQQSPLSSEVQRIMSLLHDPRDPKKSWANLDMNSLVYSSDNELASYTIRAVKGGYFTNKRNQTMTLNTLTKGMDGEWDVVFDETTDQCRVSQKLPFPKGVSLEPPSRSVTSKEDAVERYDRTRWQLGVDALGRNISFNMEGIPHVLVVGGTGGGKSVWARSLIEFLRTGYLTPDDKEDAGGGWTIFIGDGKGSDFAALEGLPGIAMVTPGGDSAQTAVMVRRIRVEVQKRFDAAKKAKKRGDTAVFSKMGPILLLLDEWGATAINMNSKYGKTSEAFLQDIDLILRLGRECRVHCVLLSQSIRKTGAGAVPGSWQENLGLTVSLGPPSDITLQSDAFTPETRMLAEVMGSQLKGKQGRGLTAVRETGQVIEFQSYYGWSPGTTILDMNGSKKIRPPTEALRNVWTRWVPLSNSVPWLAPRIGIKAEDDQWREGDLDVVASTPTVALTDRDGNMKEGMEKFDPSSEEWIGAIDLSAEDGQYATLEF